MEKEKLELVIKASALRGLINAVYDQMDNMTKSELEKVFGDETWAYFFRNEIDDALRSLNSWFYNMESKR